MCSIYVYNPLIKPSPANATQVILSLGEDGTMAQISERYFNSSLCPSPETSDASTFSENLTFTDMRAVFVVYGVFIGASFVSWLFGGLPKAKRKMKRLDVRREEWPEPE